MPWVVLFLHHYERSIVLIAPLPRKEQNLNEVVSPLTSIYDVLDTEK